MGGYEWEGLFASGRRFRLPAKEFTAESYTAVATPPTALAEPLARIPLDTDQFRARQTLEALRVGIVPVQDAETLTIGLEAERVTLDRALDRSRERGGDVLAVIGDYGFGKSHFIELAARRALRENFLVAGASLDLVEVPPGKAHKIYEALVTALRYPDTTRRGLLPLVEKALALDLLPILAAGKGYTPDKVEGFAIDAAGAAFVVTDNDGVDDSSGETWFLNLGPFEAM